MRLLSGYRPRPSIEMRMSASVDLFHHQKRRRINPNRSIVERGTTETEQLAPLGDPV